MDEIRPVVCPFACCLTGRLEAIFSNTEQYFCNWFNADIGIYKIYQYMMIGGISGKIK